MRTWSALLAPLFCCTPTTSVADEANTTAVRSVRPLDKAAAVTFENDLFFQSDRYYTDGVQLLIKQRASTETGLFGGLAKSACQALECGAASLELVRHKFGQLMYTPVKIALPEAQPDDRPWAGMLYYTREYEYVTADRDRRTTVSGTVGIVGPGSLAEQAQKWIHRAFSGDTPRGWDNQIGGELGLMVLLEQRRAVNKLSSSNIEGVQLKTTSSVRAAVGNIMTFVGAGGTITVGKDLEPASERNDISTKALKPPVLTLMSEAGAAPTPVSRSCVFDWLECSAYASVELRWMLWNVFLDGRAFGDGPSINRKPLVADGTVGVRLDFPQTRTDSAGPWYISLAATRRTPEFYGRRGDAKPQSFGTVTIGTEF